MMGTFVSCQPPPWEVPLTGQAPPLGHEHLEAQMGRQTAGKSLRFFVGGDKN